MQSKLKVKSKAKTKTLTLRIKDEDILSAIEHVKLQYGIKTDTKAIYHILINAQINQCLLDNQAGQIEILNHEINELTDAVTTFFDSHNKLKSKVIIFKA